MLIVGVVMVMIAGWIMGLNTKSKIKISTMTGYILGVFGGIIVGIFK